MWLLNKMLRKLVTRGELIVNDHDGKEYRYGHASPDRNPVRVRLTDKGAAFHIAKDPRVGAGEAYMDGRLVIEEGDVRDLVLLIRENAPWERQGALEPKGPIRQAIHAAAGKLDQVNWKSRSRRNAEHTYNLTRRLYELFLDEDRQYTCAYYRDTNDSLEQAQLDKKAHIAAKLALKPGMKVLDIGCGWGGLALYLHRHYDVDVLGVALAPDQIEFCRERAAEAGVTDRVKFELMDYRDVQGEFDRITSVGLIEHLGTPHYPGFFAHMRRLLKPDGVMFSHCCGRMGGPGVTDKWTRKYIFPGGYIPSLSELVSEAERNRLIVTDVEALRFHYAHTLEEWYHRTTAAKDEIIALYDERFFRMWQFYLAGAEAAFRYGGLVNWQLQYVRRRDAIPMTRDFMFEEERRLFEAEQAPEWHIKAAAE
ncbi:cyclopropane-fatty-acyl-phospholipid synthase family protein [Sphingosinicella rhizophila]|uniref:Cyclopropane-fatty-acyl-phospholipid synthase family protein n=1 Tax=Sphingosinicella rhizophila TaxID=3050082 RepID=A0ABU3Q7R5_9SPHN|nr:cyclopropane-fatty-acyl-phospholipid synthase family protein [Sphingosinicella sp. GR2756]MDT9599454.1 cyclopropane-fatty-acyl-phospholipid synthase family protein [Sphingosinicella sp. GR2756]